MPTSSLQMPPALKYALQDNMERCAGIVDVHARPEPPRSQDLPAYLTPILDQITEDDVSYLYKKDALSLPTGDFRDALIRSFLDFVYPFCPLLSLRHFLAAFDERIDKPGKISVLLFQAVMFAGVAFVEAAYIVEAGFSARKAARRAFYNRTKVTWSTDI